MLGRTFTADEDRPGNDRVVVLSDRLWMRRFGGKDSAVGRPLRMNGVAAIVGVMPESFDMSIDSEELWTPIAFTPAQRAMHDEHYLAVYGRLKPERAGSRRKRSWTRWLPACVTIFQKTTKRSASACCRLSSSSSATSGSAC
jgi:hypothetical protein